MTSDMEANLGKPELFIGIVSRMGTDTEMFLEVLTSILGKYQYQTKPIKVTEVAANRIAANKNIEYLDERYHYLIEMCDSLRAGSEDHSILAKLSIVEILDIRAAIPGNGQEPRHKTVYVINQLKRPEEIELIRAIYGRQALIFSLHDSASSREARLSQKIAASRPESTNPLDHREKAVKLLRADDKEESNNFGQDVRGAFPLADFVVDMGSTKSKIRKSIKRFFDCYFGSPYSAPNVDEIGMNFAYQASLASTDTSRQVGAALVDEDGSVALTGYNDAPRAGGGYYLENHTNKYRDIDLGNDANERHKSRILANLIDCLCRDGWIDEEKLPNKNITKLYDFLKCDEEGIDLHISRSDIFDLLEFGRSVHAEMSIITTAAKKGIALKGRKLYCTTYPCHNCAKHIVASGIKEVFYLEPYPKSLVEDLHGDAILNVDELGGALTPSDARVIFRQFVGVAPHRFALLFRRKRRKEKSGKVQNWSPPGATVHNGIYIEGYFLREEKAVRELAASLKNFENSDASKEAQRVSQSE